MQIEQQHRNGCHCRPVEGLWQGPVWQTPEQRQRAEIDARHRQLVDGDVDRMAMTLAILRKPLLDSFHGTSLAHCVLAA
ncbi:hypothetical protein AERO8C_70052 [Aeromonas veronii]|uniref:Uncharacterized protein n=1 Tax=Aeromonas veronii TaxID=654 RepID=A0A653LAK7_AERVE|nr:hypothetical protein AERO8C_70052 [Aeromonas veronii]